MHLDLETYVPYLLGAVYNKMSSSASRAYLARFGVGVIDWRVLSMLAIEQDISASRICQVVGLDKAAVSRSITLLERKGAVAGSNGGGRGNPRTLRLTPDGQVLHDRIFILAKDREARLLTGLSLQERAVLTGLLRRLHANLPLLAES